MVSMRTWPRALAVLAWSPRAMSVSAWLATWWAAVTVLVTAAEALCAVHWA